MFPPSRTLRSFGGLARGLAAVALLLLLSFSSAEAPGAELSYPEAPPVEQIDDYHGTPVPDPYRWLEDPDTPDSRAWIEAQNELTYGFLEGIPAREHLRERLTELWNYERYSAPFRRGDRYFYFKNDGLQSHAVLYVQESLEADPRVLIDPNTLSEDGTVSLASVVVSEDGRHAAWSTSEGGSDWRTWYVRDVESGEDLDDVVRWSKFSGAAWSHDNAGFFYSAYDEPVEGAELEQANYFQKLYYHRLGTPQSRDELVYERPDHKEWGFSGELSDEGRYLLITVWEGTDQRRRMYTKDLEQDDATVVPLLDEFDASYEFIGNDGPVFYILTNNDAPKNRIVAVDTRTPAPEFWRTLVPEGEDVIDSVGMIGDHFIVETLHDARSLVRRYGLDGSDEGEIALPDIGSLRAFRTRRSQDEAFYSFMSFTSPLSIYRYDAKSGESASFRTPTLDFDASDYVTKQVFYTSKDGTPVPMFVVHRRGLKLDGSNPTYLYGYGGFNIAMTPRFSTSRLVWLEMGGIFAQACLRGGGEYGEDWHQAGSLDRKQNTFDDFIAAGEYLVSEGYTSSSRLAIAGGSNGGLLVGACANQRPDLFGAALPAVGVMDMLRFHKWTIGWAWVSDYGSADDATQFPTLLSYSPYHNITDGTRYPATFITTADHDDRVVPAHSFKYAARLQAAQGGDAPILIRIQTRAGHGAGKPTAMMIEEEADRWAFLMRVFGLDADAEI